MQRVVYAGQQYQNDVLCSVVLSRGKYSTNNYNNNNGGSSKRSSNDMLNNQIRNTTNERVSLYIVRYTPVPGQKTALNDDHNEQHESSKTNNYNNSSGGGGGGGGGAGGKTSSSSSSNPTSPTTRSSTIGNSKLKSMYNAEYYASKMSDVNDANNNDNNIHSNDNRHMIDTSGPETKESTLNEHVSNFEAYRNALKRERYDIVSCHGDGNCLFRSISHQVYGTENHHLLIRRKCVEYMSHNSEHFAPSCEALRGSRGNFTAYLRTMAQDARDVGENAWGDYPEIGACAEIYGRRIEIWTYDSVNDGAHVQDHCKFGIGFDEDNNNTNNSNSSTNSNSSGNNNTMSTTSTTTTTTSSSSNNNNNSQKIPIRLSFFKGGHYDSIIDPHHWKPMTSTPGKVEDGAIALAKTRAPGQLNAAIQASRAEANQIFFGNNDTNNNNSSSTNTTTNSNGIVGMDAIIVQRVMRDSERQHVEDTLLEQVQKASEESFRIEQQRFEQDMMHQAMEASYNTNNIRNNNNNQDDDDDNNNNNSSSKNNQPDIKRKKTNNNNNNNEEEEQQDGFATMKSNNNNNNNQTDALENSKKMSIDIMNINEEFTDPRFLETMVDSAIEKVIQMGLGYFPKGLIKHSLRNFQDGKTGTVDVEAAVSWLFADGERYLANNLHLYKDD